MDNRLTLIAVLATIGVETGGFKQLLSKVTTNILLHCYKWRSDLGNDQAGDGARFYGRANYRDYGQKLGVDLEGKPDLALDSAIAARILADYFADDRLILLLLTVTGKT